MCLLICLYMVSVIRTELFYRRKELGYTQSYISEFTGFSVSFLSDLENGKSTTLSLTAPRQDLTAADVTAFLTEVIAKQAIVVNGSPVTAIKKIYIEDVDEKVLA